MSSTFNKFNYAVSGETPFINSLIELVSNKGYKYTNKKNPSPKEYTLSKNGYELIIKDAWMDDIYYVRQSDNNKITIISHLPDSYWWTEYYPYKRGMTLCNCRNYQIPTNGYIEQTIENIDKLIRGLNKRIHSKIWK
ncbi:MAG: hypothetical protein IJH39_07710 [Clostridia bacterium]|nr:hypothetical protein [Clostridia bacterium]